MSQKFLQIDAFIMSFINHILQYINQKSIPQIYIEMQEQKIWSHKILIKARWDAQNTI